VTAKGSRGSTCGGFYNFGWGFVKVGGLRFVSGVASLYFDFVKA
jgi:hypothetical protein